jgi:hypothetical protein
VDFFGHLEMHLRQEHPPLCGRDHLSFRSAYFPVRNCVDGDMCGQYASVSWAGRLWEGRGGSNWAVTQRLMQSGGGGEEVQAAERTKGHLLESRRCGSVRAHVQGGVNS